MRERLGLTTRIRLLPWLNWRNCCSTADYSGAEPLLRRALKINETVLGPDHPTTATILNDLAELLRAKADYSGAEPLYRRALEINEKALGPDNPSTAIPARFRAGTERGRTSRSMPVESSVRSL